MALGAPYLPVAVPCITNGVISNLSASDMSARFGAGNIKTASAPFVIHHRGHTIAFAKGVPMVVDAALASALTAANAPVS